MEFDDIWRMARLEVLDNSDRTAVTIKALAYHKEHPQGDIPFEEIIQNVKNDRNKEH